MRGGAKFRARKMSTEARNEEICQIHCMAFEMLELFFFLSITNCTFKLNKVSQKSGSVGKFLFKYRYYKGKKSKTNDGLRLVCKPNTTLNIDLIYKN